MHPSSMTRSPLSGLRPVVSESTKICRMGFRRRSAELGEALLGVVDVVRVGVGGDDVALVGRARLRGIALGLPGDAEAVVDGQLVVPREARGELEGGDRGVPLLRLGERPREAVAGLRLVGTLLGD